MFNVTRFNLLYLLAVLVFYYFLASQQPLVWLIKGLSYVTLLIVFLSVEAVIRHLGTKIFFKEAKNHIQVLLLLSLYFMFDYGERVDLLNQAGIYLVALSFFSIGLLFGVRDKFELMRKIFSYGYIISLIGILPYVVYCARTGKIDKYAVLDVYGGDIYAYILFWPFFLIFMAGGFAFTYKHIFGSGQSIYKRGFYTSLLLILVLSIVFSSFTAVLIMLLIIFFAFAISVLSNGKIYKLVLLVPVAFAVLLYGINYLSTSEAVSEDTRIKFSAMVALNNSNQNTIDDETLDAASGFRWNRMQYALDAFVEYPIIGAGYYKYKDDIRISSNHSSILDGFAKFGLLYFFFLKLYLSNIHKSFMLFKQTQLVDKKVFASVILGASVGYFALSFVNPYLEFATINVIFFMSGWVRGQLQIKTT